MAGAPPDVTIRRQEAEQRLEECCCSATRKSTPKSSRCASTIEELKVREAAELKDLQSGGMGTGAIRSLSANPVYQQIQSQLNQSHVEIASLQGAVSSTVGNRKSAPLRRPGTGNRTGVLAPEPRLRRDQGAIRPAGGTPRAGRAFRMMRHAPGLCASTTIEPPRAASTRFRPNARC